MKALHLRISGLVTLSIMSLALLLGATVFVNTTHASTVFAGMYPSLTQSGDETYQQQVNQGQQTWLLDPGQTSLHLAEQLFDWPSNSTTTLQSGGGTHDSSAVVVVNNKAFDRGSVTVTLARLDGNTNGGIWIITAVTNSALSVTNPQPYATLPSSSSSAGGQTPYTVTGTGSGFEGVIGSVYLYNSSYQIIAGGQALGSSSFSTPLTYSTTSAQDALVALCRRGAADGGINGAVLVKVTIS
jgi:hypothetical protein